MSDVILKKPNNIDYINIALLPPIEYMEICLHCTPYAVMMRSFIHKDNFNFILVYGDDIL
jgi:hypothetical protein